ncbi:MAG: hypothetical protein MRERV_10c041 [Mycoplasmataceae bacterium RV_VA103A]|nr:MAG: hypothetical protein MRERV_10c041 [Mycoplasmataceae bacterium RV_VA103A]
MPLFQKQPRKWQGGIKIFQKEGIYFCTYNQQSHQKEYLKKGEKTHQPVGKYAPSYQKKTSKTKNRENFSNLPFLLHFQKKRGLLPFFKNPP